VTHGRPASAVVQKQRFVRKLSNTNPIKDTRRALLQIEAKKAFSPLETRFFQSSIGRPVGKQLFSGED